MINNVDEIEDDPFDYIDDEDDDDIKIDKSNPSGFSPRKTFLDEKKKPVEEFDDYYK